jgi:hypothetical protein
MSKSEEFIELLTFLEKKWSTFALANHPNVKKNLDPSDIAEFNELIETTVSAQLDVSTQAHNPTVILISESYDRFLLRFQFRFAIANSEIERLKGSIKIIISSLKLNDDLNYAINTVLNMEKWSSSFGLALLSGKLIGNASMKFIACKLFNLLH